MSNISLWVVRFANGSFVYDKDPGRAMQKAYSKPSRHEISWMGQVDVQTTESEARIQQSIHEFFGTFVESYTLGALDEFKCDVRVELQALAASCPEVLTSDNWSVLMHMTVQTGSSTPRDYHTEQAKLMFGVEEPTAEQRALAKSVNYARIYGSGVGVGVNNDK